MRDCLPASVEVFTRAGRHRQRRRRIFLDGAGCYYYCYGVASVWRHPRSKYWTACFRDQNGRQRRHSTKATDRKKAQRIADEYEKTVLSKRTLRQVQKVLDRLHEEISGEAVVRTSPKVAVEQWLKTKQPETAPATMAFYRMSLGKFVAFLGDRAADPISEITRQDVVSFRSGLSEKVSPKTANHDLKAVRMFFRAARRDGLISEDPAEFVEAVRQTRTRDKRPFTVDQLRSILEVADEEWRSVILFGLYTGQRLGDIATLRWSNIDLGKGELRLVTSKTNRILNLPLAPPLLKLLEACADTDDPDAPLHPRANRIIQEQGRSGSLSNQFARLLAAAGLRKRKTHKGTGIGRDTRREVNHLSFHSLRRTATTFLHEAGIPAAVAQTLIGRDSEQTHEIYISVGPEALRRAVAVLPVI
jgi:integrase